MNNLESFHSLHSAFQPGVTYSVRVTAGRTEAFKYLTCLWVMYQLENQAEYIRREREVQAGRFATSVCGIVKDHLWLLYVLSFT